MSSCNRLNSFAVALLLALISLVPCRAAASNGDGNLAAPAITPAESHPVRKISLPAEAAPNAPLTPPPSPLLIELQQLKEAVEGQAERIAKQNQEIESERADLRNELDRIAKIEAEMTGPRSHAAPSTALAADTSPVSALDSPPGASTGTAVPAQTVQTLSPPVQGSVDRRLGELEQRLKKLGPLSFSGDFRLREDAFFGGPSNRSLDQNLQNYRLRFNVDAQLSDDLSGGFTLASGNINDPTSTNQTLTGFYARKPIALDRAFINYHAGFFKPLTLVAGKFTYPWYNTEMTWDKDLNPEGFGQTLNFDLKSTPVLKRVAFIGFELPFAQMAGVSLQNKSLMQSAVYGGQFQTEWRLTGRANFTAYSGFYNFHDADPMALALSVASAKNPATPLIGLLPLAGGGGAVQNSITTTSSTSVVNINGAPVPTGVSKITNAQFGLQSSDCLTTLRVSTSRRLPSAGPWRLSEITCKTRKLAPMPEIFWRRPRIRPQPCTRNP